MTFETQAWGITYHKLKDKNDGYPENSTTTYRIRRWRTADSDDAYSIIVSIGTGYKTQNRNRQKHIDNREPGKPNSSECVQHT